MDWVDLNEKVFHRQSADGSHVRVPLQHGDSGFCVAVSMGETFLTEVPNLFLEIRKRPASAAGLMKKPAKSIKTAEQLPTADHPPPAEEEEEEESQENDEQEGEEEEEDEQEADEEDEQGQKDLAALQDDFVEKEKKKEQQAEAEAIEVVAPPRGYTAMFYKSPHSIGIRQKFYAKVQVFSFGGKRCGKSEQELRHIAAAVIAKLERGEMSETDAKDWAKQQVLV